MQTLAYEVLLDAAGVIAAFIAYVRPTGADKSDSAQRKRLLAAGRTADREYNEAHSWARPVFLATIVSFAIGGFFVIIYPGAGSSNQSQEWLVAVGYSVQIASVIAMAVTQTIRGTSIRRAMRAVL